LLRQFSPAYYGLISIVMLTTLCHAMRERCHMRMLPRLILFSRYVDAAASRFRASLYAACRLR